MRFSIVTVVCLGVMACNRSPEQDIVQLTEEPQQKVAVVDKPIDSTPKVTVAFLPKGTTNPFWVAMEQGARRAADELDIELLIRNPSHMGDVTKQQALIYEMVARKVDAIVIAPVNPIAVIPALHEAHKAGVLIVNVDDRIDVEKAAEIGMLRPPFVSVDNEKGAFLAMKTLLDMTTARVGVIVLQGDPRSKNAQARQRGALRAIDAHPRGTLVATEAANWRIDEAYAVTSSLYSRHKGVGAIFAANDLMALGAIQFLNKQAIKGVLVAGYDGLREAHRAIREGSLHVTVDQQPAEQGRIAVELAVAALSRKLPSTDTLVPVKVITANNVDRP